MSTTLEVIKEISQIAALATDGALDSKGNPLSIGLRREKEVAMTDRRLIDGFAVQFYGGDKMCLKYHAEVLLKEIHNNKFESEVEQTIQDVASFLKKEYKKVTGKALTLNKFGEMDIDSYSLSRVRNMVEAKQHYKIGALSAESYEKQKEKSLEKAIENFLTLGKNK